MPALDEETLLFNKWRQLIKTDKIRDVLLEAEERRVAGAKALECVVFISRLAYEDTQNDVSLFQSRPEDVLKLTEVLCSSITSQPALCNLRLITSLYHIAFFFYKRNHLEYVRNIFDIVLETKRTNISTFQGDGRPIYDHFILLMQKVFPKILSNYEGQQRVKENFGFFLEFLVLEDSVENGSKFLETLLYASQTLGKQSKKMSVELIRNGLEVFSKVKKIIDVDSSLTMLFKIYSTLFFLQLNLTGYTTALTLVLSYVEKFQGKFCQESVDNEGLHLLRQAEMFMSSQSEWAVLRNIDCANMVFKKFQNKSDKKDVIKEACLLMLNFVSNLNESKTKSSSVLLGPCLGPFLEMVINLHSVLKGLNVDNYYYFYCFCNCYLLVSEKGLKKEECLKTILKTQTLLTEELKTLNIEKHPKVDYCTKLFVTRCANLIQTYNSASLNEQVIAFSKPVCKLICTMPAHLLDDTSTQVSVEVCFTYLIQALGPQNLYEVLELAVAWLLVCPQSSTRVFRLWGNVKHNAICAGSSKFLDTTVFTIVKEGKLSLEEKWIQCNPSTAQLGNLLVKELNTYFINRTLRGSPVMEAARALESLAVDVLTQARGVVVALDVISARSDYTEHRDYFLNRSKQLLASLRKQKNQIDPVEYNCSLGELLYSQFRFKLKSFRESCEGEVLRLSTLHETLHEPLVAELPEDRPDPDDTCDVTTRYANLSLDKQQQVLASLDASLQHWKVACTRLSEKVQKMGKENTKHDLLITLSNLQEAAMLMRLYCDDVKEAEFWNLMYNLALLSDDAENIVIAVGEMLKTRNIDPDAVEKAEEFVKGPNVSKNAKHAFLLNKALFHLSENQTTEGVKLLKSTTETVKNLSTIMHTSCLIILGQCQQKSSDLAEYIKQLSFAPISCHLSFHKALSTLLYLSQQEKWNSLTEATQIEVNLLQVAYVLGKMNWGLEQPREARMYVKEQLSVAQKLGLPLRSAQLLLVLAWVDLYTGMMDDCAVKIDGLEALLDLQGTAARYDAGGDDRHQLSKSEISDPEFLGHHSGCDCFMCRCTEYQRLVLETLTLRATFCVNNNRPTSAQQCFKVVRRVEDYLSKSDDAEVQISLAHMWKHQAETICASKKDAFLVNRKALETLSAAQEYPSYSIVLQHVQHQSTWLQSFNTSQRKPIKPRIVIEKEEITFLPMTPVTKPAEEKPELTKTPLNEVSGNISPKFKRPVRKLTLPSSGDENTPPPRTPKYGRKIKPPPKFTVETPKATPKPLKTKTPFTIFDDDGNVAKVSSSKTCLRVKEKDSVVKNTAANKKLFGSDEMDPETKLDFPPLHQSPIRKSNRKPTQRTYGRSKCISNNFSSEESEASQGLNSGSELKTDSGVFSLSALKQEVVKIKQTLPKSHKPGGSSTKAVNGRKNIGLVKSNEPTSVKLDSDCSIVEGTPSPPSTRRTRLPRKVPTRSKKN